MFNRVSVWLDDYAPEKGAFAHASDWAARLHVPLHVVAAPAPSDRPSPLSARRLLDCGAACLRKGLSWDSELVLRPADEAGAFFRDADLCAFGADLPSQLRDRLLRESLARPRATVMICPASWQPHARTLILHRSSAGGFLDHAVSFCLGLGIQPVVLSVAASEGKAEERQGLARERCYDRGLAAEFDLIAGCDVRTALERAARARGCSHVIIERENDPPWRRWLRGNTTWRLLGLADWLTLITLPGRHTRGDAPGPGCEQN